MDSYIRIYDSVKMIFRFFVSIEFLTEYFAYKS